MKKILLFTAVAAVCLTTLLSCKKEAKTKAPAQIVYPVQAGTVAQLSHSIAFQTFTNGPFEMGVAFKSSVSGNIKSLKLNLPATGSKLVTLWKSSDQSVVQSKTIICSHVNSWDDSTAVDIPIEANVEYILSVNSTEYFFATVPTTTFPYVHENIIILSYKATPGASQTFPGTNYDSAVFGLVDFTFQRASS